MSRGWPARIASRWATACSNSPRVHASRTSRWRRSRSVAPRSATERRPASRLALAFAVSAGTQNSMKKYPFRQCASGMPGSSARVAFRKSPVSFPNRRYCAIVASKLRAAASLAAVRSSPRASSIGVSVKRGCASDRRGMWCPPVALRSRRASHRQQPGTSRRRSRARGREGGTGRAAPPAKWAPAHRSSIPTDFPAWTGRASVSGHGPGTCWKLMRDESRIEHRCAPARVRSPGDTG